MKYSNSWYFSKTENPQAHLRGEEKEPNLMRLNEILLEHQAADHDTRQMKVINHDWNDSQTLSIVEKENITGVAGTLLEDECINNLLPWWFRRNTQGV